MSTLAAWSYVEGPVTIWPSNGTDEFGQPIAGTPYLIPSIDYSRKAALMRDENGTEYVSRLTIYFEAEYGSSLIPKRDWYAKIGSHLGDALPPSDAERIKDVRDDPAEKFGSGQIPDWIVTT